MATFWKQWLMEKPNPKKKMRLMDKKENGQMKKNMRWFKKTKNKKNNKAKNYFLRNISLQLAQFIWKNILWVC